MIRRAYLAFDATNGLLLRRIMGRTLLAWPLIPNLPLRQIAGYKGTLSRLDVWVVIGVWHADIQRE